MEQVGEEEPLEQVSKEEPKQQVAEEPLNEDAEKDSSKKKSLLGGRKKPNKVEFE